MPQMVERAVGLGSSIRMRRSATIAQIDSEEAEFDRMTEELRLAG